MAETKAAALPAVIRTLARIARENRRLIQYPIDRGPVRRFAPPMVLQAKKGGVVAIAVRNPLKWAIYDPFGLTFGSAMA